MSDADLPTTARRRRRLLMLAVATATVLVVVGGLAWWLAPLFETRFCTVEAVITSSGGSYNPCRCAEQDALRARFPDWLVPSDEAVGAGDCPAQVPSPID